MDAARGLGNVHGMVTPHPKPRRRRLFLREWRKYRRLTQERLADQADLTQGMISQLEGGKSDYTGELLERLADALSCDPVDILIRNPLDVDAPWSIWDRLKPEQRKQAIRMLKTFIDDEAAA